jgi:hypothetical protein
MEPSEAAESVTATANESVPSRLLNLTNGRAENVDLANSRPALVRDLLGNGANT